MEVEAEVGLRLGLREADPKGAARVAAAAATRAMAAAPQEEGRMANQDGREAPGSPPRKSLKRCNREISAHVATLRGLGPMATTTVRTVPPTVNTGTIGRHA